MNSLVNGVPAPDSPAPRIPVSGFHPMSVDQPPRIRTITGRAQNAANANPRAQDRTTPARPRRRRKRGSDTTTTTIVVTMWLSAVSANTAAAAGLNRRPSRVLRMMMPR